MNEIYRLRNLAFVTLMFACPVLWAQPVPDAPSDLLVPAPSSNGYTVDNRVSQFKVHKVLPQRMNFDIAGDIDGRYQLANLWEDEAGRAGGTWSLSNGMTQPRFTHYNQNP